MKFEIKPDFLKRCLPVDYSACNPLIDETDDIGSYSTEPRQVRLAIMSGPDTGKLFYMNIVSFVIGSINTSDIQLSDSEIADHHVKLNSLEDHMVLLNICENHSTYINGDRVHGCSTLRNGDTISLGNSTRISYTEQNNVLVNYRPHTDDMSRRDSLTNTYNKEYFSAHLYGQYYYAKQFSEDLGLVLIHIDKMEQVKIKHGETLCITLITNIAIHLHEFVQATYILARCDYEYFAILCPQVTHKYLKIYSECIRKRIASSSVHYMDEIVDVTASIGIASLSNIVASTPMGFIDSADKALSEARNSGGNCVISA